MFWDTVSPAYVFFEVIYNSRVYRNIARYETSYKYGVHKCPV